MKDSATHANIRCRTIVEVLGKPKEHVEKALAQYLEKIKDDEQYVVLSESVSPPEEQEEELWGTFVELEMLAKGLPSLVRFCFDFMPSSVEILKPIEMNTSAHILNGLFNDLQSRLHNVDMVVKNQKNEIDFLKKNMRVAIKNIILTTIHKSPSTVKLLSEKTNISVDQLKPFITELLTQDRIQKDGDKYRLKQ